MTDVQFDEEVHSYGSTQTSSTKSGITGIFIRFGFAKDESGAVKVMIVTVGILVVLGIVAYVFIAPHSSKPQTPRDASWPKPVVY